MGHSTPYVVSVASGALVDGVTGGGAGVLDQSLEESDWLGVFTEQPVTKLVGQRQGTEAADGGGKQ